MDKLIAVYGPTMTGKLDFAVNLAKYLYGRYHLHSELISADSRKVYKGMNLVQSKLYSNLKGKITLHLVDFLPLDENYTLYQFKKDAEDIIHSLHQKNRIPILVGGTGTYILSVIQNWRVPKKETAPKGNLKTYGRKPLKYNSLLLCTRIKRSLLYKRIMKSVDRMFEKGLYEEFLQLARNSNLRLSNRIFDALTITLGYRNFFQQGQERNKPKFDFNSTELSVIKRRIKTDMKNYARRQEGWLKKMEGAYIINNAKEMRAIVDKFMGSNDQPI